jgi:hypothetical protein
VNRPSQPYPSKELIESTLEASCDALISLELVEATLASGAGDQPARERNRQAIEAVRAAIDELRFSLEGGHSSFAMGFVLRREQTTRALASLSPDEVQSKPRRTA